MVTVSTFVRQPIWQVGQEIGAVTVTVGVVGHNLFAAGNVIVLTSRTIQSGCIGQTGCFGHESAHCRLVMFRYSIAL